MTTNQFFLHHSLSPVMSSGSDVSALRTPLRTRHSWPGNTGVGSSVPIDCPRNHVVILLRCKPGFLRYRSSKKWCSQPPSRGKNDRCRLGNSQSMHFDANLLPASAITSQRTSTLHRCFVLIASPAHPHLAHRVQILDLRRLRFIQHHHGRRQLTLQTQTQLALKPASPYNIPSKHDDRR